MISFGKNLNSDQIIKSTVRIINHDINDSLFVGTGFFFSYNPDVSWNARIEAIVTNKHVVNNSKVLKLSFRTDSSTDKDLKGTLRNYDLNNPSNWIFNHPDPDVDLCIIFLKPITDFFLNNHNETLDISYFTKELIPDQTIIDQLSSIEDILMIGYPKGIIDQTKLFPITRKGITSSPYYIDFNNKKDFLTDIFAIGGSSGSPVILYKLNNSYPYLLGVHYAGLDENKINLGLNLKSFRIIETYESFINLKLQDPNQREYLDELKKS
ncbi:MAG: hypothetical protein COW66_02685 [Flavobacteriaceae bacterium CG18_big_fil_WC_8_21_14_2_50_34_36]|nr:MAG: hypothetical protein COW66_02685 [Flavobacteriaceae bacterium CG18_big_fil_WC_8_21_14_2_50_34_36]PJC06647.1 MAG: hypothetical protein CO068_10170 [Flavobacteriaceae bacterium CG_4_9_14_0_8_um_filter_34_30]